MFKHPEGIDRSISSNGLVVVKNELTLAQVGKINDSQIKRRQHDLEDRFGRSLKDVVADFSDVMAPLVERGLSINLVTAPGHEEDASKEVYAASDDYVQIALLKRSGRIVEDDANQLAYLLTNTLLQASREMNGGILSVRAGNLYRRVGSFTTSLTLDRVVQAIENDCDQVDLAGVSPYEVLVGAEQKYRLRDVEERLKAKDFRNSRLELVIQEGVPIHTSFLAPFVGDFFRARDSIAPQLVGSIFIPNTRGIQVTKDQLPEAFSEPTKVIQWRKAQETLEQLGIEERVEVNTDQVRRLGPRISKKKIGIISGLGLAAATIGAGIFLHKRKS